MGALDWLEMGIFADAGMGGDSEEKFHNFLAQYKGSFGVTIGDALTGIVGARNTHIFGEEIKLVCDVLDLLGMSKLEEAFPIFSALLNGVGGQTTYVIGSNTNAHYKGPKMAIDRATAINRKNRPIFYGMVEEETESANPPGASEPTPDAIVTEDAVKALLILTSLITLAAELAVHFAYPKFGTSNPTEEQSEEIEDYGAMPEFVKMIAIIMPTRLMAFIRLLEEEESSVHAAEEEVEAATETSIRIDVTLDPLAGWLLAMALRYMLWRQFMDMQREAELTAIAIENGPIVEEID